MIRLNAKIKNCTIHVTQYIFEYFIIFLKCLKVLHDTNIIAFLTNKYIKVLEQKRFIVKREKQPYLEYMRAHYGKIINLYIKI